MKKIMELLMLEMERPTLYGWFHCLWIIIIIIATIALCTFYRKCSNKQYQRLVLIVGITNIILECYKQIIWASYNPITEKWHYLWGEFPFVFCSTPMYVMITIGIIKNEKIKEYLNCFLGTFSLLAGILVILFPADVIFRQYIGLNLQTMICHGAMVVIGIFAILTKRVKHHWTTILKGLIVFMIFVIIASIMNLVWWHIGDRNHPFNMLHISPYYPPYLPVYENIWVNYPYPVYLFLYIFGFTLGGSIIFYGVRMLIVLNNFLKIKSKKML